MMKRTRAETMAIVPMLPPATATGVRWWDKGMKECLCWLRRRLLFSCRMIALASTRIATFLFDGLSTTIDSGLMEKMVLRATVSSDGKSVVASSVSTFLITKSVE